MKNEKNRKLKGSVLLTVVFVMAILIVFMFGTLSLALSASNRSHVNYSSAQTSVTARAVAESAISAIANNSENGKAYATAIANLKDRNSLEVGVQLSSDADGPLAMGDVSNVVISHIGTTDFYDPVTNRWETRDVLKFTANVEMAGVVSTSSVYVVKHYDKDTAGGTGGGAGFVTTAGANLKTQTSVFGGAYISLPELSEAKKYNYAGDYATRMASRTFRKVEPGKDVKKFEMNNSGAVLEADVYVNSDMYIQNWSGFVFPYTGTGITVLGDLGFDTNAKDHLNYIMVNKPSGDITFQEVPYLYVDGKITGKDGVVVLGPKETKNNVSTIEETFPFNTFCASIEATHPDSIINSNIYCMDEGLDSIIKGSKHTLLYTWAGDTINKIESKKRTTSVGGEICTMGNLTLENIVIDGDVRVKGNLTVTGKVIVNGDVAVEGNITGTILTEDPGAENANGLYVSGNIYCDSLDASTVKTELEIQNKKGYFNVYDPTIRTVDGVTGYTLCNGQIINDHHFANGMLKNDTLPAGYTGVPKIYHTMNENELPNPDANGIETDISGYVLGTDYFYEGVSPELDKYKFTDEEGKPCFYCETKIVGFQPSDGNTEGYEVIKIGDTEYKYRLKTNYYTKVESPTSKHMVSIGGSLQKYLDKIGEDEVYPEYATREAVLAYPGSGYNEDTKIVKTIEEVLTDVANPYNQVLPGGMKSIYDNETCIESLLQLADEQGIAATADQLTTLGTTAAGKQKYEFNGETYYHVKKEESNGQWADVVKNASMFISESCKLGGFEIPKGVIIDPGSKSIVIGVDSGKTLTFAKSDGNAEKGKGNIFVDDAEGGDVYFYIDNNATLDFKGNILLTRGYWDLFKTTKKISYNTPEKDGYTSIEKALDDRMKPNVQVFGIKDAKLNIANCDTMSMYVKSPEISTSIGGGTGAMADSFLYNGYDVIVGADGANVKQLLIGCFNVKEAEPAENQLRVVFIPEDGGKKKVVIDQLNNFWYRPYYYSEF